MSGHDARAAMMAEVLEALPDPLIEVRYRDRLAREAFEAGLVAGRAEEHERQLAEEAQRRRGMSALVRRGRTYAEVDRCRWIVRGEERTRETFGRLHPDDWPGARAGGAVTAA